MDTTADLLLQQLITSQASIAADISVVREQVTKAVTRIEVVDSWRAVAEALHADHEQRLRGLERFRYTAAGFAAIGGAVAGYLGYLLGHYVH